MEIEIDYAVEVFHPRSTFNQIYFEAVANAFDAGADDISIKIISDGQISPIGKLEISITDNGNGFTNDSFDRFCKVKRPKDTHHKGVGRLVYLQYFASINITSAFNNSERRFTFSKDFNGQSKVTERDHAQNLTELHFAGFSGERLKSFDDIKPGKLREKLIQHFLPFFFDKKKNGKQFSITIELQTDAANVEKDFFSDTQIVTENDIPLFSTKTVTIQPNGTFQETGIAPSYEVIINYVLKSGMGEKEQFIAASIDGRTIPIQNLLPASAVPLNNSAIFLLESNAFGESDSGRQKLVTPSDITIEHLYRLLRSEISTILSENLPEIAEKNTATRKQFEDRFPHLVGYFDKETVGIINKDEAIETAQRRFFRDQKKILESETLDNATFEKSLEISSRTLTAYILYRDLIIQRLSETNESDKEGTIHDLIVPRKKIFHKNDLINDIYNNNAWLLDDKFMTFRTILSDIRMDDVISAIKLDDDKINEAGRPDISMIFSNDPTSTQGVEVVIVEAKRKTDDEKENGYVINQLLDRATKLAQHCPNIQRIWYYALIQINPTMATRLRQQKWAPLFSKGQVFYQEFPTEREDGSIVPTPIFVMSFDAIVADAKTRNHTFLEILKNDLKDAKSPEN